MRSRLIIAFIVLLCTASVKLAAQTLRDTVPSIMVIGRSYGDSILLRWAPNAPMAWKQANASGYVIERYQLTSQGKPLAKNLLKKETLTNTPITPWPLSQWEALAKSNANAAIAAQALYGQSFQVSANDNGMSSLFDQAKELEYRFSYALFAADQSLEIAEASGLCYKDKSISKGEKYLYKIYSTSKYLIDTGYVLIDAFSPTALPIPNGLKAEFADQKVLLSWSSMSMSDWYTTYIVERSDDGGKTYRKVNQLPIVNLSEKGRNAENIYWADSLPSNNVVYYFRVKGVTPFEETSEASESINGAGKGKPSAIIPSIETAVPQKDGSIQLKWRFDQALNPTLDHFTIERSDKADGKYYVIGAVTKEQRVYKDLKPARVNYYVIKAVSMDSTYTWSFPVLGQPIDSIPPAPPTGLIGKVELSGKVVLSWDKGKENDIAGYRVYRAASREEEFSQVTVEPVRDSVFIDSIVVKTLTEEVYYKVIAFDLNYNPSSLSDFVVLKRPDVIPPVPPVITNFEITDSTYWISWIPSTSQDVVAQRLYRKEKGSMNWSLIREFDKTAKEYKDLSLVPRIKYDYVLVAIDDAGLESEKKQVMEIMLVDYGFRPGVLDLKGTQDRMNKYIKLEWVYENGVPEFFQIYRAEGSGKFILYKSLPATERLFKDYGVKMNTSYSYKIKVKYRDGGSSVYSYSVILQY